MKIFHHRQNTALQLRGVPSVDGVEIDLRSSNGEIILQHDPFLQGEVLSDWLDSWDGQEIILNIKEEGIEDRVLDLMDRKRISHYFFLDQSFPFMMKLLKNKNTNTAARVSDLESVETALAINTKWVWVDCFNGNWDFLLHAVPKLQSAKKKICLVSPELVRNQSEIELDNLQALLKMNNFGIDGVCTKLKSKWAYYDSN
jgi:hypothetical protein